MSNLPNQTPITGREAPGDARDPASALAEFYRAFNARDLDLMARNWDSAEDISMDNPLGGIKRGWAEIGAVYRRVFEGAGRVEVEFRDYTLHEIGDVFFAVGRERGRFERDGKGFDLAIRTSRTFRRVNGRWRQVHHHGSMDDPALLASYQQAVAGVPVP